MRKAVVICAAASVLAGGSAAVIALTASHAPGVQSLWSDTTPGHAESPDPNSVNVGLKFHSTAPGQILGVRFYKGPDNTGTHVGTLWSADGRPLATVTFRNESATGWQSADFSSPVDIDANSTYEVSYLAPHGHYAFDDDYLRSDRHNGDLVAEQMTQQSANGVYVYSATTTHPATASRSATNYWVDVMYQRTSGSGGHAAPIALPGNASSTPSVTATPSPSPSPSPSKTASSSPAARPHATAGAPVETAMPKRPYVQPGSVGYLGSKSSLKVYEPGGKAPSGCDWLDYGLRCDQTNLSLDHVWIKGSLYWTGTGTLSVSHSIVQGGTGDSWYAILGHPDNSGSIKSTIKVTDSTVGWLPGKTVPSGQDTAPIWSAYGNQAQIAIRDDLSGMPQGIDPTGGSIIQDNWIHGLVQNGSADSPTHLDGIFSQGGGDIIIDGNYVNVPVRSDTTAAIFIQDRDDSDTNITITNNYLNGGAFNLRNQTGVNVTVSNNTFANSVWGAVGDVDGYSGTYGTWTGNTDLSGKAVTKP